MTIRALKGTAKRRTSLRDCWMWHGRCGAGVAASFTLVTVPACLRDAYSVARVIRWFPA